MVLRKCLGIIWYFDAHSKKIFLSINQAYFLVKWIISLEIKNPEY